MNKYDMILEWLNDCYMKDSMNKEVEMVKYPDGSVNYFFPTGQIVSYQSIEEISTVSLAPFASGPNKPYGVACVPTKKKESNPMYTTPNFDQAAVAYDHLSTRADQVRVTQRSALEKAFGLVDDPQPKTAEELINRVLAGKYILKDGTKEYRTSRPSDYVTWRDPAVKEDRAGFEAACKQLDKQYQSVQDIVIIGTPIEALKAINDFAAWTPAAS